MVIDLARKIPYTVETVGEDLRVLFNKVVAATAAAVRPRRHAAAPVAPVPTPRVEEPVARARGPRVDQPLAATIAQPEPVQLTSAPAVAAAAAPLAPAPLAPALQHRAAPQPGRSRC